MPELLRPEWADALERELIRAAIPGASVAVTVEGEVFQGCWGYADLAANTSVRPEHVFHLFSGTKLFTATLVMSMVEAGELRLEAPAASLVDGLDLDPAVQVQHLLCHDAGLTDTLGAFLATHAPEQPLPRATEALRPYAMKTRGPGHGARYTNVDYALLGAIAEQVGGKPFDSLLRERVLAPLGSAASLRVGELEPWAVGYDHVVGPMRWLMRPMFGRDKYRALVGARTGPFVAFLPYELDTAAIGGLCGTAEDFVPFLQANLEPASHPVLSAPTVERMLDRWANGSVGIMSRHGAGCGWKLGRQEGRRYFNHEGGGAGFTTELRIYPEEKVGIVLLMNRLSRAASVAADRFAGAVVDTL